MVGNPQLILADELTSSMDAIYQLEFFKHLKMFAQNNHIGVLFVSHDLAFVHYFCDYIMVLTATDSGCIEYFGKCAETITVQMHRKKIQMVLQNPYSAFDPLAMILTSLSEVLISNNLAINKTHAYHLLNDKLKKYAF